MTLPTLLRRQDGVWRPLRQTYGPTGRACPNTPAYNTPASHTVTNLHALETLLMGGTVSSGEVIEITDAVLDGTFTINSTPGGVALRGGSTAWPVNALVRPPLGQRTQINQLQIQTKHVTFAGLDATGSLVVQQQGSGVIWPERSGFWRCAAATVGTHFILGDGGIDTFLWECISANTWYGDNDLTGSDHDCIHVDCTVTDVLRPVVAGCYVAPRHLGVFPALYLLDTTNVSVRDITTTISGLSTPFDVTYIRINVPGTFQWSGGSVTVALKKNGVTFKTITSPSLTAENFGATLDSFLSDYWWGKPPVGSPYVTFNNGDTLTVSITSVTGVVPRLLVNIGVPSGAHADSFQTFTSPGAITNLTLRDCALLGAANAAVQTANVSGTFVIAHNFLAATENYGVNFANPADCIPIIYNNIINGKFVHRDPILQERYIERNALTSYSTVGTSVTLPPSNIIDGDPYPVPPDLADLEVAWPECPYVPLTPYGNRWGR